MKTNPVGASRRRCVLTLAATVLSIAIAGPAKSAAPTPFTTVPIPFTWRMQAFEPGFPSGPQTFGGVPFAIPTSGNNIWASYNVGLPATRTIPVGVFGVGTVHTLMNTYWGEQEPGTLVAIEFNGSDGAFYRRELDGNVDIRDWNAWPLSTNLINGTTTVNALTLANGSRLDRQIFTLPAEFRSQTLASVRLIDNGERGVQTIFLAGLTVQTIPEPAAASALAMAAAFAWTVRRKRNRGAL